MIQECVIELEASVAHARGVAAVEAARGPERSPSPMSVDQTGRAGEEKLRAETLASTVDSLEQEKQSILESGKAKDEAAPVDVNAVVSVDPGSKAKSTDSTDSMLSWRPPPPF